MFRHLPLAALLALAALPVAQAEEPRYNQISLRAEASREVPHDRMHVTLLREEQHSDPAQLAARITASLNRALERARQEPKVSVSLGARHSQPVYEEKGRRIVAWRERAELRLESADFAALARLSAALQEELQVAGLQFSLSADSRHRHEDALLREAVAAFRQRASLLTEALGGQSYRLVRLDLNGGTSRPPLLHAMAAREMSLAADMPVPQIEAGNSELRVSADGVIEVRFAD